MTPLLEVKNLKKYFKTAGGSAPPNAYLSLATREKIM